MVGKYLNGYGVVDPPRRSRRDGRSGSRSPAGPSRSATASSSTRTARSSNYPPQARQLHRLRPRLQGQRAAQGMGAQPQAVLPLLQPEQPARRERAPRSGRRAIPSPRRNTWGASATSRHPSRPNFDEANVSDKPKQIRDIPRLRRPAARRHRPPLPRPAREPALGRRRGEEDRQPGPQVRGQAQDLLHLHLRQRPRARRAPDRVQGLPLRGGRAGPADHPRPRRPAEHDARPAGRQHRPRPDDRGHHQGAARHG